MKGAKILIESLKKEGVEVVFGYPGGKVIAIYDELFHEKSIKHYLTRHEQGAIHAAEGYARTTGKPGVCLVTSGPGATNTITGIANAHMDSIPLVVITGQVGTNEIGKDAFQEADIVGITLPITKHNYLVKDVNDLARIIKEAFYIATTGRPGPVLIDIPGDITGAEADFNYPKTIDLPSYKPTVKGNSKQIKEVIKLITKAKKPLVLAGGGVKSANASQELRKFLEITGIPVCTTLMGLGLINSNDDYYLGMPGMHGTAYANYAIDESDLLFAVGMRFDDRITGKISEFAKNAKIIHIDVDPAEINKCKPATIPVIGDAKAVLAEINKLFKEEKKLNLKDWQQRIKEIKTEFPMKYQDSNQLIKPQKVIEMINKFTKSTAIYATDVGEHQMWACQYLKFKEDTRFVSSGGLGTMGFGLPAAMGAAAGNPDKPVVVVTGDGSVQMNIQELNTIAVNNFNIKILVLNNQYLGMVRQWQQLFFNKRYSHTDLEGFQPDFMKLAQAYGIKGVLIDKPQDLDKKMQEIFEYQGPVFADIRIAREENVLPFIPAGATVDKMILE